MKTAGRHPPTHAAGSKTLACCRPHASDQSDLRDAAMRQAEAQKHLMLCRAGPLSTGGKIDFTSITGLAATPDTADGLKASAGGLGLLPWYIHPANMYSNGSSTDVIGNAAAAPPVVSASSVPAASDAAPVAPGSAAPQASANAGSGTTSG